MIGHLRLVAASYAPWMILNNDNKNDCEGVSCPLLKYLAKSLNFSFEFVFQKDIGTGYQLPNGSWTGALGVIHQDQADLTGTPIVMFAEPFTQGIIEYVQPFFFEEAVILTRYDDSWNFGGFDVINILGETSWLIFSILLLWTVILITFFNHTFLAESPCSFSQRISNAILIIIGIFLGKDIMKLMSTKWSTIFLLTSWLFSSLQLAFLISGEITTMFTLKIPNKQMDTLQDLLDSKMSLVAFSAFMPNQNIQDKKVFSRIKQKVEQDKTSITIGQMIQNEKWILDTLKGKSAMLLALVPLKTIVIKHSHLFGINTKFRFIEERYRQPFFITLASSMRLPKVFRDSLNLKVLEYITTGIIDHRLKQSLSPSDRFFDFRESIDATFEQINLDNLIVLFKLLLISQSICILTLLVEYFIVKITTKIYYRNNKFDQV